MKHQCTGNGSRRVAAFLGILGILGVVSGLYGADSKKDEVSADAIVRELQAKKPGSHEKKLLTGTDGGGNMIVFTDHQQIVRVTVTVWLSNRSVVTDLFFSDGSLTMSEYLTKFAVFDSSEQTLHPAGKGEQAAEVRETMLFRGQKLLRWTLQSTLPREKIPDPIGDWKNTLADAEFFYATAQRAETTIDIEDFLKNGAPARQQH